MLTVKLFVCVGCMEMNSGRNAYIIGSSVISALRPLSSLDELNYSDRDNGSWISPTAVWYWIVVVHNAVNEQLLTQWVIHKRGTISSVLSQLCILTDFTFLVWCSSAHGAPEPSRSWKWGDTCPHSPMESAPISLHSRPNGNRMGKLRIRV